MLLLAVLVRLLLVGLSQWGRWSKFNPSYEMHQEKQVNHKTRTCKSSNTRAL